ncbi:MAG: hypothetical protein ACQEXJ_18790 [Myxococcota bacterium]
MTDPKPKPKPKPKKSQPAPSDQERTGTRLPASYEGLGDLPLVASADVIAAHDGETVRVEGTYVQVDVRMAKIPPPRHVGHAAVELPDGRRVHLFPIWHEEGKRPAAETERFEGRRVIAVGTLHEQAPEEPHGGASPLVPTLDPVEALLPAD